MLIMLRKNQRVSKKASRPPVRWYRISEKELAKMLTGVLEQARIREVPVYTPPIAGSRFDNVDYKKIRVLLFSGLPAEEWRTEQLAAEELRRLVKEVTPIKTGPGLGATISMLQPELIIFLGQPELISQADLVELTNSSAVKAAWLADTDGTTEATGRAAAHFDVVMTQHTAHIPLYHSTGCKRVFYLPFSADTELFYPKPVDDKFRSDLLVIGDNTKHITHLHTILKTAGSRKIILIDNSLQDTDLSEIGHLHLIQKPTPSLCANYFNGAGMIIHLEPQPRQIIEASSCGAFQITAAHPDLYEYMGPGEDIVTYHSMEELEQQLEHYLEHADQRRAFSSRAQWKSRYDYSYLQMVSKLLYVVFHL